MSTNQGMLEANKAAARRWNEAGFNQKRIELANELIHPSYAMRSGTDGPWSVIMQGREAMIAEFSKDYEESPTFRVEFNDIFAEGDRVALRVTAYNGDQFIGNGIIIYRFEDGKIIDDWYCWTMVQNGL